MALFMQTVIFAFCAHVSSTSGQQGLLQAALAAGGHASLQASLSQASMLRGSADVMSLLEQATRPQEDSRAVRTMRSLDANGDGRVDASEIASFAQQQGVAADKISDEFMSMDTNHDGALDLAEISAAMSGVQAAEHAHAPRRSEAEEVAPVKVSPAISAKPVEAEAAQEAEASGPVAMQTAFASASVTKQHVQVEEGGDRTGAAESTASLIARELSIESEKELDARTFDRQAAELRANATALAEQTAVRVLEAGGKAAQTKAGELLETLTKLEGQAQEAEVQAAALRAKSKAELAEAEDLMSVANSALGQSQQHQGVGAF